MYGEYDENNPAYNYSDDNIFPIKENPDSKAGQDYNGVDPNSYGTSDHKADADYIAKITDLFGGEWKIGPDGEAYLDGGTTMTNTFPNTAFDGDSFTTTTPSDSSTSDYKETFDANMPSFSSDQMGGASFFGKDGVLKVNLPNLDNGRTLNYHELSPGQKASVHDKWPNADWDAYGEKYGGKVEDPDDLYEQADESVALGATTTEDFSDWPSFSADTDYDPMSLTPTSESERADKGMTTTLVDPDSKAGQGYNGPNPNSFTITIPSDSSADDMTDIIDLTDVGKAGMKSDDETVGGEWHTKTDGTQYYVTPWEDGQEERTNNDDFDKLTDGDPFGSFMDVPSYTEEEMSGATLVGVGGKLRVSIGGRPTQNYDEMPSYLQKQVRDRFPNGKWEKSWNEKYGTKPDGYEQMPQLEGPTLESLLQGSVDPQYVDIDPMSLTPTSEPERDAAGMTTTLVEDQYGSRLDPASESPPSKNIFGKIKEWFKGRSKQVKILRLRTNMMIKSRSNKIQQ